MSIAAIYQSLQSVISNFVGKDYGTQIDLARPFVASVAETFSVLEKKLAMKSASLGERKSSLSEQERNQVHEIVDQLLKTKDADGHPLLRTAIRLNQDKKHMLQILRFLAENGFAEEVTKILLSEMNRYAIGKTLSAWYEEELKEIIDMLPKETQEYLKSARYSEYGGFNDTNVYETFIIGGGTHRAS
ncbi:MAG: hypothetical protein LBJ75_01015 [Puniceicoccales bacterium]|nr:hypothetical protein [Puniceicoccales bacterium]